MIGAHLHAKKNQLSEADRRKYIAELFHIYMCNVDVEELCAF